MALLSISGAAKLFNVSRPTLQKAIKDGTITGKKVQAGGSESWQIDTAELSRLYTLRNPDADNLPRQEEPTGQRLGVEKPGDNVDLSGELVTGLQSELQAARAEIEALRNDKAEAARELAASQAVAEERRRILDDMMKLLPKPDDQARRKGLWSRLFGGG